MVQPTSRWRDRWDQFEASAGLVAAFVLAFGPLTIAAFTLIFAVLLAEWRVAGVAAAITAVTCPMALWLARMAASALQRFRSRPVLPRGRLSGPSLVDDANPQRRPPFAMVLAATLPPLPRVARVPLGLWWFAHFLAGTALVEFAGLLAQQGVLWEGFRHGVPAVVFVYLLNFAANAFLVLAVTAFFGSPTVTACIWRMRFVIDALFALPLLLRIIL